MRMDWMKSVTQHLFVLTESFVWFIAIRVTASALDRDAMGDIARDLESGFAGPVGDAQIVGAVISMRAAMEHVTSGPSLPSVRRAQLCASPAVIRPTFSAGGVDWPS